MKDLVSVEEAIVNGAENLLQQLMFRSMLFRYVFNICYCYIQFFILLLTIGLLQSKNRRAITGGRCCMNRELWMPRNSLRVWRDWGVI